MCIRDRRSAEFDVPAAVLYEIIADYDEGHAAIVPPQYFAPLVVKEGGQGAGTVVEVTAKVLGQQRVMMMTVSEPEPGRVLVEEDAEQGVRTAFTVDPVTADRCRLTLTTHGRPVPGLRGLIENRLNPMIMGRVMEAEFVQINNYLNGKR